MPTEYAKIDTLFERKPDFTVDTSVIKKPVFKTINPWHVTEKIDGTNVRISLSADNLLQILARTDNGQLPGDLISKLLQHFTVDRIRDVFPSGAVILFGEGYGAGIQKGGAYRPDKSFIMFDILVDDKWWLDWEDIVDVGNKLQCDVVPDLGLMTLDEIVDLVKEPFASKFGLAMAEGVIAKPVQALFDKAGKRVILKLKTKDFRK